jgi:hypothetical protein
MPDRLAEPMRLPGLKALFLDPAEMVDGPFESPYIKGNKCYEHIEELVDMKELRGIVHLQAFKTFLRGIKIRLKDGNAAMVDGKCLSCHRLGT